MDFNLEGELRKAIEDAMKKRGRFNILIAGRSGVGKSTLINAVFQSKLAETGQGKPVTQHVREYSKTDVPVTILDTRGLEMDRYEETVRELEKILEERGRDEDPQRHIHVAWICIAEDTRRVEDGEAAVADLLARRVPTLGVITKSRQDEGFRVKVQELLPQTRNVVRVRALHERFDDGHTLEPMGLESLIDLTMEVVPDGQKGAVAAAQRVSMAHKKNAGHKIVAAAAVTAGAIGANPMPFSDVILLVPVQIGMLAGVTLAFGLPVDKAFLSTLVSSAVGVAGASFAGRAIVTNLLKLVPGGGSLAGGTIGAATAAALTTALGEVYLGVLAALFDLTKDDAPSQEEIQRAFTAALGKEQT